MPIISAPTLPMAPASVGVNQPANRPPMVTRNSTSASATPINDFNFCAQVVEGPGGPAFGLSLHQTSMVPTKRIAMIIPGIIPAM